MIASALKMTNCTKAYGGRRTYSDPIKSSLLSIANDKTSYGEMPA